MQMMINADDFGQTHSCTKAIYEAYKKGLITDTTMVANGEAFDEAVAIIKSDPEFAKHIGIHLILTEDKPLTDSIKKCPRLISNGSFTKYLTSRNSNFIPLTRKEKDAIYVELTEQVRRLKDSGVLISHADSHHHVHTNFAICNTVFRVCRESRITRVRKRKNVLKYNFPKRVMYKFYNLLLNLNGFTTSDYLGDIDDYKTVPLPKNISAEAIVHPDYDKNEMLIDRAPKSNNPQGNHEITGSALHPLHLS